MSQYDRLSLPLLPTGVPGLDEVLGGGLPEFSLNLISGTPGAGKTTLAHQIMFANASVARPALYFTVMGEPPVKMLRYQQQMDFFDPTLIGTAVRFVNLSDMVMQEGLDEVLARIVLEVEAANPSIVIVDSFQAITRVATERTQIDMQGFTQLLALQLTFWQATTFLIGEYVEGAPNYNPVLTVADGMFVLSQHIDNNAMVRKFQVVKSRGQAVMPGLHTLRLSKAGLQIYPRMSIAGTEMDRPRPLARCITGVAGLDAAMGGGIPLGDAVMVSGPSGAGKSVLATQFIAAGVQAGEPGVIAVFEEHPREYLRRAESLNIDLETMEQRHELEIIYIRPLDLSPDETLHEIREAVQRIDAKRVVIDSVSGFELALAPTFRTDFRESLYRLVGALTGTGITVLMTMEIVQQSTDLRFSPYIISFLTDDILLLRYVEIAGQIRKSLAVIKMRNSDHSKDLWRYEITDQGMVVRESLQDYRSIGTGTAELREGSQHTGYPGLVPQETIVLQALIELGAASAEAIAQRIGQQNEPLLQAALDRLLSLGYAVQVDAAGPVYRPVVQLPTGDTGERS